MNLIPRHFRSQLLLAFFVIVVVPLMLVFGLVYRRSASIVREEVERAALGALQQGITFVEYQMQYLRRLSELVAFNRNLRDILLLRPGTLGLSSQLDDYAYLSEYLSSLQSRDGAYRIRLYIDDRWFYSKERFNIHGLSSFSDITLEPGILAGRQTITLPQRKFRYNFEDVQDILTVVRLIYAAGNLQQVIAVVCVDALSENIGSILSDMLQPYGGTVRLLDEGGATLLEIDAGVIGDPSSGFFSVVAPFSKLGWTMDVRVPQHRVFAPLITFQRFVLGTAAAMVVSIAALGILLSFILSRRVTSVVESIRAVRAGSLSTRAVVAADDEIGLIEEEFNSMVAKIAALVSQVEQDGISLREAELKALQSQINPHFLYNTLDLISWKALQYKATEIHELVIAMAKFYKSSLARGEGVVSLADECEHVRLYTKIENLRFDDSIEISFDIEESLADCALPKITLQPLVENAIHHGILESDSRSGHVLISARRAGECLHVEVINDGLSFLNDGCWHEPEGLGILDKGFGIHNIHARLRVMYGQESGLSFRARAEGGTIARIRVPLQKYQHNPPLL